MTVAMTRQGRVRFSRVIGRAGDGSCKLQLLKRSLRLCKPPQIIFARPPKTF